jgi:hypothetical protein
VFVDLEPIESSGALTATILEFEKRFLERCRAIRNSTALPELVQPRFRPGVVGPPRAPEAR